MNLVRTYDHLLGEGWSVVDGGATLGMYWGQDAKTRAERRLETLKHKPLPLQRTVEARAKLLTQLRREDLGEERSDRLERAYRKVRARERGRLPRL